MSESEQITVYRNGQLTLLDGWLKIDTCLGVKTGSSTDSRSKMADKEGSIISWRVEKFLLWVYF